MIRSRCSTSSPVAGRDAGVFDLFGNGFYASDKRRREAADGIGPMLKVTTKDLGSEVEIRVRDNGTGIAPEFMEKLFQPFFYDQADRRMHRARPVEFILGPREARTRGLRAMTPYCVIASKASWS